MRHLWIPALRWSWGVERPGARSPARTRCSTASARCRGAQQALLRARLAFAAERGVDITMVVTQPESASQRNAER